MNPAARRRLARTAGLILAAAAPGLALGTPGTPLEVELTRGSLAAADFGDARLRGTENRIAIRGPSLGPGEGAFSWALDYAYQRYEYEGLPSRDRDLHRAELLLRWQGDTRLSWTVEVRPVIASSSNVFKEFWSRGRSNDFMWHGGASLQRFPAAASWGWRLGAMRDDAFGREAVYPVAALLREHSGMQLELGWPVTRALLDIGGSIELGGEVAPAGARWHVVSDERGGASFDYDVRAWRAGAILRWISRSGFAATARAGLEFERRHRFQDNTGAAVNRRVGGASFFELGVGYHW